MSVIRLPIDIKSLYFNIKNDNETGHTATVATPLRQGNSIHKELSRIIEIPEMIGSCSREDLVSQILTKSRAQAKINGVFVFGNISVNGTPISTESSYCIYIREETDPGNVHYGRQKVHYPTSLKYEDNETKICNRDVVRAISDHLHHYAFIVEAFEYDTESSILNFDVIVVGENDMPYSKVFINKRGVGNKFTPHFMESSDIYDAEILSLREKHGYAAVTPENFNEIIEENNTIAKKIVLEYLDRIGAENIRVLKEEYPYSIYDIQYTIGNKRKYSIIKQTATKAKYFTLPISKIQFCNDFSDEAVLMLVTDINGDPKIHQYFIDDLNGLNKSINSITYEDRK